MRILVLISIFFVLFLLCAEEPDAEIPVADTINASVADSLLQEIEEDSLAEYYLAVDVKEFKLYVYLGEERLKTYSIATGKNTGDKQKVGDCRTPLGNFRIQKIEPSAHWVYDYGDGKGYVNAYGPWFIRLETHADQTISGKSWTGIGIHGTHDETSIGKRVSRGCLRLHNEDLLELVKFLKELPDIHIKVYIREEIKEGEGFNN
jgi:lipoprotein-anchoring transpeptidase ErfK/SrfK